MKFKLTFLFLIFKTLCFSQVISHSIIYGSGQSYGIGQYRLDGIVGETIIGKDSNKIILKNGFQQGDLLTLPATKSSNIQFSQVTDSQIKISWSKGNGRKRILLARPANASFILKPKHNLTYNANAQFGSGQQMGDGSFVVLNDTNSNCTVSNLSPNTNYFFTIIEYNYNGVLNWYDTVQTPIASQRTCPSSIINKPSNRICRYDSLPISGLNGGFVYNLLKDTNIVLTSTINSFYLKQSGIYRLRITDPINACIATSQADTFVFKTIDAGKDTSVNCGDSIMLMPTTISGTYQWSPSPGLSGTSNPNPFVRTSSPKSYILRVTDMESCTILDTIEISVYNQPLISKQAFTITCGDSSEVFTSAVYRGNYQWLPSIGIANPISRIIKIAPSQSTKYSVVVTDDIGCIRTDSVQVNVQPLSFKIASISPITCGDSLTLKANIHPNSAVKWLPNAALSNNIGFTTKAAPNKTTYYKATLTHTVGCEQSDSVVVNVLPFALTIQKTPSTLFCGDSMNLLATPYPNYRYVWRPDSLIISSNLPSTKVAPIASRYYNLEVSNAVGCVQHDSVWVQVNSFPHSITGNTSITCNDSVLIGSSFVKNAIYNWTPSIGLASPNKITTWAYPNITRTYIIQVIMPNGCKQELPLKIDVKQRVFNTIKDTAICRGQSIKLSSNFFQNELYSWTPTNFLDDATIASPTATPDQSTQYIVKTLSYRGCENSDTVNVTILDQAQASFEFSLDSCYLGDSIQFLNQSTFANKFKWDFGDGVIVSNITDPFHFYKKLGSVNVTLYAMNTNTGCNDTLSKRLNVVLKPKSLFDLVAYPNPASSIYYLNVISSKVQNIKIHLVDGLGKLQNNYEYEIPKGLSTLSLPLEKLNNGLYYIQIEVNGKIIPYAGNTDLQVPTADKMKILLLR